MRQMVNFPILNRLDITDYGLFPGSDVAGTGLHAQFNAGLTLVIGANGLGKSTFVSVIYRLLTGPFDIPALAGQINLGNASLDATELPRYDRSVFAQRVADGARNAKARLSFQLGSHALVVERRLNNLSLSAFEVDGSTRELKEEAFQNEVAQLVGVWSFGDWILLLRHLVFYFEDRRALVWDASAQRQILRFLFLPAATARKWTENARTILELDSRMRNLSAATTREQRSLAVSEFKTQSGQDIRQQLSELEKEQTADEQQRDRLNDDVVGLEAQRQQARLRVLQVEQEHESRFREMERARLTSISARFPNLSETARYILAQLFTDKTCLVCGTVVPAAVEEYASRVERKMCVVCGTDLSGIGRDAIPAEIADKQIETVSASLKGLQQDLDQARRLLEEVRIQYQSHLNRIEQLEANIAERSNQIESLIKRLPPGEMELHRQRTELAAMRSRVGILREELGEMRQVFSSFMEGVRREMAVQSEDVKRSFDQYAEGFTLELCHLVWSSRKAQLGQTGDFIEFPAFDVEMTGTDFQTAVRRTGPEQVSESQREFIDLAFRMALMSACGSSGIGTLVVDAPESSLDAVFVGRATNVLSRFAIGGGGNNRLVVTSNLVEGQLLPGLIKSAMTGTDKHSRIIDLFAIAIPTAAVVKLREEYNQLRVRLLNDTGARN